MTGTWQTFLVTAYCTGTTTADGTSVYWGEAAAYPAQLPFGSVIYVPGYGSATIHDTGGAVGWNHVDLYMPSCAEAIGWGARTMPIEILGT